jgi:hypothetical protein
MISRFKAIGVESASIADWVGAFVSTRKSAGKRRYEGRNEEQDCNEKQPCHLNGFDVCPFSASPCLLYMFPDEKIPPFNEPITLLCRAQLRFPS